MFSASLESEKVYFQGIASRKAACSLAQHRPSTAFLKFTCSWHKILLKLLPHIRRFEYPALWLVLNIFSKVCHAPFCSFKYSENKTLIYSKNCYPVLRHHFVVDKLTITTILSFSEEDLVLRFALPHLACLLLQLPWVRGFTSFDPFRDVSSCKASNNGNSATR